MYTTKNNEFAEALAEVGFILKYTDEELVNKIPQSFLDFMENNKDNDYQVSINVEIPLENQPIKEKTKDIMAIIYRNYFCTEEERKEYDKLLSENQKKFDSELSEKYSYENLFKNSKSSSEDNNDDYAETTSQTQLMDYSKMKWYQKVIFKIRNWIATFLKK